MDRGDLAGGPLGDIVGVSIANGESIAGGGGRFVNERFGELVGDSTKMGEEGAGGLTGDPWAEDEAEDDEEAEEFCGDPDLSLSEPPDFLDSGRNGEGVREWAEMRAERLSGEKGVGRRRGLV